MFQARLVRTNSVHERDAVSKETGERSCDGRSGEEDRLPDLNLVPKVPPDWR